MQHGDLDFSPPNGSSVYTITEFLFIFFGDQILFLDINISVSTLSENNGTRALVSSYIKRIIPIVRVHLNPLSKSLYSACSPLSFRISHIQVDW